MVARLKRIYRKIGINSSRVYLERFLRDVASMLPENALVLDAGAGDCPYRDLFAHARYEAADFCKSDRPYAEMNYVCDLAEIPVEDERFDMVICTQVLEHVPDPAAVLKELHRILKSGGILALSAPLYNREHGAPYDFYRYTQFGWRHLLTGAGFGIKKMQWLEGYCGTLSYQLEGAVRNLPLAPRHYGGGIVGHVVSLWVLLHKPFWLLQSILFAWLDMRHKHTTTGDPKNYAIVAERDGETTFHDVLGPAAKTVSQLQRSCAPHPHHMVGHDQAP